MSWVNDLASTFGIAAGAATLAVAMYAACSSAEKAARPEALKDIGRLLQDSSWERSAQPSALIERVFVWAFGPRHLSWKCVRRSLAATIVFVGTFSLVLAMWSGVSGSVIWSLVSDDPWYIVLEFVLVAALPDYIALAKSRFLIKRATGRSQGRYKLLILIATDILASLVISGLSLAAYELIVRLPRGPTGAADYDVIFLAVILTYLTFALSTLATSLWIILILLSTATIKLLSPLHRFAAWFFDIERHPVQAIGIVAGALVIVASLIWSVVRGLILS
jgi:hypothetical protein